MDLSKLDRTARLFAVVGLLAFIDTFLEWASASFNGRRITADGYTANAWNLGFWSWFPMVLLMVLGVLAVLPAFGAGVQAPGGFALLGAAVGLLCTVILLIRWTTLPSYSFGPITVSEDASYGLFFGIALSILAVVVGWMGYLSRGGSFGALAESFGSDRRISDVTPGAASTYAPAPEAQTPAQPWQAPQVQAQAQAATPTAAQAPNQAPQTPQPHAESPAGAAATPPTPAAPPPVEPKD